MFYSSITNWDVLNENIEGQWLEKNTGNLEFIQSMFRLIRQLQPEADLFMNDYGIVTNGKYSSVSRIYFRSIFKFNSMFHFSKAYRRKAGLFLANGALVQGLGIQSHVRIDDIVNIEIMKVRKILIFNLQNNAIQCSLLSTVKHY
jgi:endo-1,4-beta-xylanase